MRCIPEITCNTAVVELLKQAYQLEGFKSHRKPTEVLEMSYGGRETRGEFENKNTASLKPTKIRKNQ